jgi:hypothetical protein
MIKIAMPNPTTPSGSHEPVAVDPQRFTSNPGAALSLTYSDVGFRPQGLQEMDVTGTIYPTSDPSTFTTVQLSYLTGEQGQVLTTPCEPILPLFIRDATVVVNGQPTTDLLVRGVGFRGGTYTDRVRVGRPTLAGDH